MTEFALAELRHYCRNTGVRRRSGGVLVAEARTRRLLGHGVKTEGDDHGRHRPASTGRLPKDMFTSKSSFTDRDLISHENRLHPECRQ